MTLENYTRRCSLHRVVDGDTVDVMVDLGFRRYSRERVRLADIDAPERYTEDGIAATTFVEQWCEGHQLVLFSQKADSFGRWLGTVCRVTPDGEPGESLGTALMEAGYAVPYER